LAGVRRSVEDDKQTKAEELQARACGIVQGDIRTETGGGVERTDAAEEDKDTVNSRDSMIEWIQR